MIYLLFVCSSVFEDIPRLELDMSELTDPSLDLFCFICFCLFLSDCDVIHISLSNGNLSQSSMEGQGKPCSSIVPIHPAFTFWHNERQGYIGLSKQTCVRKNRDIIDIIYHDKFFIWYKICF